MKPEKNKEVLLRYVYHCMKNMRYEPVNHSRQWIAKYSIFTIPFPPLPVQREIVRALDNFTELTAELTDRKKQYEYYRDSLLSFGDETEYLKFKDTCSMKAGKAISSTLISPIATENQLIQCFGGNGIRGYVADANQIGEYPLIGRQGALCGNINYAIGKFYATEHAVVVKSEGKYIQKFLFYL